MIIPRVKEFFEKIPENCEPQSTLPRMSSAGNCPRLMDYEYQQGSRPVDFDSFVRMELGTYLHVRLQELFERALGDDLYNCEKEISLTTPEGVVILGHPDGRIKSLKATLEIKTVSEATFAMVLRDNKPIDAHIDQGNLYAHVNKDEWVLIVYVNRSLGYKQQLFKEFMFEYSPELAEKSIQKFEIREANKKAGIMTPRPYHDKTESPCFFCSFKEPCYQDFKDQINNGDSGVVIGDPDIALRARESIRHRDCRLVSARLEEAINKDIGQRLAAMRISSAVITDGVGPMVVKIKPGKHDNLITEIREDKK